MRTPEQALAERNEILSSVDLSLVRAVHDQFPHNSLLEERKFGCFSDRDDLSTLSEDKINKMIETEQISLINSIARYEEYRNRSIYALSRYDLTISSGNDPIMALRTALKLTSASVTYYRKRIIQLEAELKKFAPQLSLF